MNNSLNDDVFSKEYHIKLTALEISLNKIKTEQTQQQEALKRIEEMLQTLTQQN